MITAHNQTMKPWVATLPAEIIVCNAQGTILEMNDYAIKLYEQTGGAKLIGHNLYDHHQEPARSQVEEVIANRVSKGEAVIYSTEKAGAKKLICIAPWQQGGKYAGFVLITLDLPAQIPHICKD